MNKTDIALWSEQLQDFTFPRYAQLPDIELYIDQVISLLNKFLAPLYTDTAPITASMINNYVKLRLLPAPEKKRYTRTHLAHLIVITVTKQVIPITDAKLLLDAVENGAQSDAYDDFCTAQEQALHQMAAAAAAHTQPDNATRQAVRDAVVCATADKMLTQKLLSLYHTEDEDKEKEPKKEKKKDKEKSKEKQE